MSEKRQKTLLKSTNATKLLRQTTQSQQFGQTDGDSKFGKLTCGEVWPQRFEVPEESATLAAKALPTNSAKKKKKNKRRRRSQRRKTVGR